jgi:hypothetical protein
VRRSALTPFALLAALLAVLIAVAVAATPPRSDDEDPSSTASGRAGTLALYEWLADLGYAVHRVDSSFDLGNSDVLVSAAPLDVNPYSDADAATLEEFLRGGGEAIVAVDDPSTVQALLQPLGVGAAASDAVAAAPSQPFPGSSAVASVPLAEPGGLFSVWSFTGGSALVPLLGPSAAPLAVALRVGAGRLVLLGSELPLSNEGLRRGDSAALVLGLLELARGRRVAFDEVHHLPALGSGDYGLSAVVQAPLLAAVVLAVAVVLLWLASQGRRLGRPLPWRDPTRVPSVLEHVDSVGRLLARSRSRGAVAERYAEELKLRLGRAAGVDPRLADSDFAAALSGFGEERAEQAAAALAHARRLAAGRPGESQLLALARRVDSVEAAWGAEALR